MGVICSSKTEDEKNQDTFINELKKYCEVNENSLEMIQGKKKQSVDSKSADFISI